MRVPRRHLAPWVLQSLFLAAIGEARDRGAPAIEAFAYRYVEGESAYARFREHRTVFPADFLADFGFRVVRTSGRVGLARLELGGLQPVEEGRGSACSGVRREAFVPEPVPARARLGVGVVCGRSPRRSGLELVLDPSSRPRTLRGRGARGGG